MIRASRLRVSTPMEETLEWGPGRWLALLAVIGFSLLLYALCAGRAEHDWDTAQRALAMARLSISHPGGSPLHALLGKAILILTAKFSVESIAWVLKYFSAVCGALAAGVTFLILINFTRSTWLAFLAAAAMATSALPWSQSVYFDVYSLHYLLLAVFLFFWVRWLIGGHPRMIYAAAFAYALSMGAHMSSALLAPGILVCILFQRPTVLFRPREIIGVLIFLFLGMSWILYVLMRGQSGDIIGAAQRPDSSLSLLQYLAGAQYQSINAAEAPMMADRLRLLGERTGMGIALMIYSTLGVGFWFAMLGVVAGFRRALGLTLMALISIILFFGYFGVQSTMDFSALILPLWLFIAVFMVLGVEKWSENKIRAGEIIAKVKNEPPKTLLMLIAAQLIVFMAGSITYQSLAPVRSRSESPQTTANMILGYVWKGLKKTQVLYRDDIHTDRKIDAIEDIVLGTSAPGRIIMATWSMQTILTYEQKINGRFPDCWILEWHHQPRFYSYNNGLTIDSYPEIVERFGQDRDIFTLSWETPTSAQFSGHTARYIQSFVFGKDVYHLCRFNPSPAPTGQSDAGITQ